jgi:hypothetical protein
VWWGICVIPSTREAEAEDGLRQSLRLAWAGLVRPCLRNKIKLKGWGCGSSWGAIRQLLIVSSSCLILHVALGSFPALHTHIKMEYRETHWLCIKNYWWRMSSMLDSLYCFPDECIHLRKSAKIVFIINVMVLSWKT